MTVMLGLLWSLIWFLVGVRCGWRVVTWALADHVCTDGCRHG